MASLRGRFESIASTLGNKHQSGSHLHEGPLAHLAYDDAAIRASFVEMPCGHDVPVIFPSLGSMIRPLPFLRGVRSGRVPPLHRSYEGAPTAQPSSRVASVVPGAAVTVVRLYSSLRCSADAPLRGPALWPSGLGAVPAVRRNGWALPGSWTTLVRAPCSSTPAGPPHLAFSVWRCCRHCMHDGGPNDESDFGAQSHGPRTRCLRFTTRLTTDHARLAFRLLARLCRAGLSPAGSFRKVSVA